MQWRVHEVLQRFDEEFFTRVYQLIASIGQLPDEGTVLRDPGRVTEYVRVYPAVRVCRDVNLSAINHLVHRSILYILGR